VNTYWVILFQQNHERNAIDETLAAEAAGQFRYVPSVPTDETEESFHEAEGSPLHPADLPTAQPTTFVRSEPTSVRERKVSPPLMRKDLEEDDDDDIDLDMDNLQLDETLDTGDINLDVDLEED